MAIELVFARQERPAGMSTLEQVRALQEQARDAASTAAIDAVAEAMPRIETATQQVAEDAAAAGTAATQAQTAAAQSANVGNAGPILPNNFLLGLNAWTSQRNGSPLAALPTAKMAAVSDDAVFGTAAIWSPTVNGENVLTKGVYRWDGTPYRVRARFRVISTAGSTGLAYLNVIAIGLDANFENPVYVSLGVISYPVDGTEQTRIVTVSPSAEDGADQTLTALAACKYVRFGLRVDGAAASPRIVAAISEIEAVPAREDLRITKVSASVNARRMIRRTFTDLQSLTSAQLIPYDEVECIETGLVYRVTTDTVANAPIILTGRRLVPAPSREVDLRYWTGAPAGSVVYGGADRETVAISGPNMRAAFAAAARYCIANGRALIIPEGVTYINNMVSIGDITGTSGLERLTIKGAVPGRSIIACDDEWGRGNAVGRTLLPFKLLSDVTFTDVSFIGAWRSNPVDTAAGAISGNGSHLVQVVCSGDLRLDNVEFEGAGLFSLVGSANRFFAHGGRVAYSRYDGLHVAYKTHFEVKNGHFFRVLDDCIAGHTTEVPDVDKPSWPSMIITGNIIEQSQGIACAGASRGVIANNIGRDIYVRFIATTSITRPHEHLHVFGNICENVYQQAALTSMGVYGLPDWASLPRLISGAGGTDGAGISISQAESRDTTTPIGGPDGNGDWTWEAATAGGIAKPGSRYLTDYTTRNLPHEYGIVASSNRLMQTTVMGVKYSAQPAVKPGRRMWSKAGPIDPVITVECLVTDALRIGDYVVDCDTSDNILRGFANPLIIGPTPARYAAMSAANRPNRGAHRLSVKRNKMIDFSGVGLTMMVSGVVDLEGNHFDGDPLFKSPIRNPDGTFGTGTATDCAALRTPTDAAVKPVIRARGNEFANLRRILTGQADWAGSDNVARGAFVAQADPANKGIRDLSMHPNRLGSLVIEGSDPNAKASYLVVQSVTSRWSDAMPTSGWYLAGQRVDATVPIASGADYIIGWHRLTTGTGHVLGTDWRAVLV